MAQGKERIRNIVLERVRRYIAWRSTCKLDGASASEWGLRCERAYNKIHEQSEKEAIPEMVGYFPVTSLKVDGSHAAIYDMIAGVIDEPFLIRPTPLPELSDEARENAKRRAKELLLGQLDKFGIDLGEIFNAGVLDSRVEKWLRENLPNTLKPILDEERALAKKAADVEQLMMRDWFAESNWREQIMAMIHDGLLYPAAYIRGPYMQMGLKAEWDGNRYKTKMRLKPTFRRIPFFNAYMADDAESANTGSGFAEIKPVTRADLAAMMRDSRYDRDAINEVLDGFDGHNSNWVPEIPNILGGSWRPNAIRNEAEPFDHLDRVLFQGVFSGSELSEVGITGYDSDEYVELDVEVIGPYVIRMGKVAVPGATRNVYSACYRYSPDGYGRSMGVMLFNSAKRLNRYYYYAMRAMMQQSGAAYAISAEAWEDPHAQNLFEPFQTLLLSGRAESTANALKMIQAQPTFQIIWNQFLQELKITDEITGVSVMNYATPQSTAVLYSATGISAMMATAQKQLKMYLHNIDTGVLDPLVKSAHRMLVEMNQEKLRHAVDAEVSSVGLSARISKEVQESRLAQNLQTVVMAVQAGVAPKELGQEAVRQVMAGLGLSVDTHWPEASIGPDVGNVRQATVGQTPMDVSPNTLLPPEEIQSLERGGL